MTCAELCICVFVHSADLRFLHLEKYLRCRFAHFVHDGFSHICRFAHLCFVHVQKFASMSRNVFALVRICENVLQKCAHL